MSKRSGRGESEGRQEGVSSVNACGKVGADPVFKFPKKEQAGEQEHGGREGEREV